MGAPVSPLPRRTLPPALLTFLVTLGCPNPVRQAQQALQAHEPLHAFRLAREALKDATLDADTRKRLGSLVHASAVAILDAPDQGTVTDARELWAGLPPNTEERSRAAQRLFRVTVKGADEATFRAALDTLSAEMGDESQLRSNLRTTVQLNRGTPVAVTAAREVVARWPAEADRWVDLAAAHAAVVAWDPAQEALRTAVDKLVASCRDLPSRVQGYDKVRRVSAYGDLEQKRCQSFHRLVAQAAAHARHEPAPRVTPGDRDQPAAELGPRPVACPPDLPAATPPSWTEDAAAVAVVPPPPAWWLDGAQVTRWLAPASPGGHTLAWRDGKGCQEVALRVDARAAIALHVE